MKGKQEEKCSITRMTHDWGSGECIPEPPPSKEEVEKIEKIMGVRHKRYEELRDELLNKD